jgi:epoxyqueuosine reductase
MPREKASVTDGSATARELAADLRRAAGRLGLDRLGIADPERRPSADGLRAWLAEGRHAGMAYLARDPEARCDPARLLPGVRAVLSAALGYRPADDAVRDRGAPRLARYAWGEDYHEVLGRRLRALLAWLEAEVPGVRGRVALDAEPLLERHWAAQAGVGWIGRHGCLIVPGLGSWVFLGEILIDLPLPADAPVRARCGECRRCVEACPSGALLGEGPMDARRCAAYWTVEHRGPFPEAHPPRLAPWLFGCDLCQEVCPQNRDAPPAREPAWSVRPPWVDWSAEEWEGLSAAGFRERFGRTPLARAGFKGLRRNLAAWARERSGASD